MRNEWTLPIVLGVVATAAAASFLPSPAGPHAPDLGTPAQRIRLVVLPPAPDAPAGNYTLLILDPLGSQLCTEACARAPLPMVRRGWYQDGLFVSPQRCGLPGPGVRCAEPAFSEQVHDDATSRPADGLTFGGAGPDVVKVHAFVFTTEGRLKFTNDATNASRFELAADAVVLPPSPWYLGEGQAPPGSLVLPDAARATFEPLRSRLVGLPVGGVATEVLDSPTVELLFGGPLYATVRFDGFA